MALATLHEDLTGKPCMFLGTSSQFSDLAHSARQSTVIGSNTDGQTTQLQSACVLPHIWPSAVLGAAPSASPHSTPCQGYPGAMMASDPSLPTVESRLSWGESTMGLGRRSGPCREWSGPTVQEREMWGATRYCWQKWLLLLCNLREWHPSPGPTPQAEPAVLPGAEATILLLQYLIVLREARRAEMTVLHTFTCQVHCLASVPLGRQGASRQQPRLQSGLPGLLRTSSHNRKQCPRPLSFAQNTKAGSWLGPSQPRPEQE